MTTNTLRQEINLLQLSLPAANVASKNTLANLYDLFIRSNKALQSSANDFSNIDLMQKTDDLLAAQESIIDIAAGLEAKTQGDLLHKMALWRREAPELDQAVEKMTGADALAYSVFRDLVKITGKLDMLTEFDLQDAA